MLCGMALETLGCCSDYIRSHQKQFPGIRSRFATQCQNQDWTSLPLGRPRIPLKNESGEDYDVVIIHYSIVILFNDYVSRYLRKSLRAFKGIKIQIIQDEYRWVNRMMSEMVYLGIDGILSLVEKHKLDEVYNHPDLKSVLKGLLLGGICCERVDRARCSSHGKPFQALNLQREPSSGLLTTSTKITLLEKKTTLTRRVTIWRN